MSLSNAISEKEFHKYTTTLIGTFSTFLIDIVKVTIGVKKDAVPRSFSILNNAADVETVKAQCYYEKSCRPQQVVFRNSLL